LSFSGGELDIQIQTPDGTPVQDFAMDFPSVSNLPIPDFRTENGRNLQVTDFVKAPVDYYSNGGFTPGGTGGPSGSTSLGALLYLPAKLRLNSNDQLYEKYVLSAGDLGLGIHASRSAPVRGDLRAISLLRNVPSSYFEPVPGYPGYNGNPVPSAMGGTSTQIVVTTDNIRGRFATALRNESKNFSRYAFTNGQFTGALGSAAQGIQLRTIQQATQNATLVSGLTYSNQSAPVTAVGMNGTGTTADFTSSTGMLKDGATFRRNEPSFASAFLSGFFTEAGLSNPDATMFEPNRMVPSAGVLGSLLTTDPNGIPQGWQSLLLNPYPLGNSHPGLISPKDHYFTDLFWMPVIEPYPVSEPLSTAGKVNLNSQLAPFTHITRTTALRGLMNALMIGGVSNDQVSGVGGAEYKHGGYQSPSGQSIRHPIHLDATLDEHRKRFELDGTGSFYRSATEICDVALVPAQVDGTAFALGSFWMQNRGTSDTLREQPYTALLSRVTTKSNTFTVHYRVQALRQPPRSGRSWTEWDESKDQITGEYRGSTTIERFLDPNTPNIPDYTTVNLSGSYEPIDKWYRWRVLSQKQFAP
jgi:uncharacterized protein (TIGR02600 family)